MKAYTYVKPGLASFVDVDKPVIRKPTDAIVRIVKTTICGTDLHIIKKVETKLASTLEIMLDNVFHHLDKLLLIPNLYLTR